MIVIEKAGSDLLTKPSLTLITMFECVPTAVGVPLKSPVAVENVAHAGRFEIENVSALPLASLAVGWKA